MGEASAASAKTYREHMRSKAERLGGGADATGVDSSSFTPAEKLYAGVKTGMRPVSRQARADGGPVFSSAHAAATPGRAARKAGGGLGDSYNNRDQKASDEEREGHYPNGGMKAGGRAHRAEGGYLPRQEAEGATETRALKRKGASAISTDERPAAEDGRRARADGGPLATPLSAGMGGQGRMNFNFGPQASEGAKLGLKDGGRAKAHERYGHGPSCSCPSCRSHKAYGGDVHGRSAENRQFQDDAAETLGENKGPPTPDTTKSPSPGPAESRYNRDAVQSAIDQSNRRGQRIGGREARMIHGLLKGRQKGDYAKGGEVAEGAIRQHKLEHKALGKAKGGRVGRAHGGKSGKGKTNINIIIGHPGSAGQPPVPPLGANPQLAIRPPPAAAPMPMPGAAPPPGAPAPMPIPIPMGGAPGMPPGMPPRARGGRAPKPEAGAGSGLGRLQKIREYGARSREGRERR